MISEIHDGLPHRDATALTGEAAYAQFWRDASANVGEWLNESDSDEVGLREPMVARTVVDACSRHGLPLVIGSSMPVRDVEWWCAPRESATYSNRGANGIDGVVSTVLGVAAGGKGMGLVGDITLLHDVSGLVDGLGDAQGTCVLVVVNNHGGGIFSFLPQATSLVDDQFERLFATPRSPDAVRVAQAFGHRARSVATIGELRSAIDDGLSIPGLTVVVAEVASRDENVRYHEALNRGVRDCWRAGA